MSDFSKIEELYIEALIEELELLLEVEYSFTLNEDVLHKAALSDFKCGQLINYVYDQFEYAIDGADSAMRCRNEAQRRYDVQYGVLS